jgi:Zn finger protein HypA/HybF involved in hydrogenase expression
MIIINVQCDECQATCTIEHDLDDKLYEIERCPFCQGEDIQIDIDEEII